VQPGCTATTNRIQVGEKEGKHCATRQDMIFSVVEGEDKKNNHPASKLY
jgi:hypothetical protein